MHACIHNHTTEPRRAHYHKHKPDECYLQPLTPIRFRSRALDPPCPARRIPLTPQNHRENTRNAPPPPPPPPPRRCTETRRMRHATTRQRMRLRSNSAASHRDSSSDGLAAPESTESRLRWCPCAATDAYACAAASCAGESPHAAATGRACRVAQNGAGATATATAGSCSSRGRFPRSGRETPAPAPALAAEVDGAEEQEKTAGVVPDPVAARIEGSACRSSHSMVCPSDLSPSSRVSWNTRAAHTIGIRTRRPRPFTLLCRSLPAPAPAFFGAAASAAAGAADARDIGVGAGMARYTWKVAPSREAMATHCLVGIRVRVCWWWTRLVGRKPMGIAG
uniref:Uncharacterized protein n=1 Tax=Zea mays TaxID=4577 RepID=A0A804RMV6_MAIZE